jgi:hypothetical protein
MIYLRDLRGLAVRKSKFSNKEKKPRRGCQDFVNVTPARNMSALWSDNLHSRNPLLAKLVNEGGRVHVDAEAYQ